MPEYPRGVTERFHGTPGQMAIALVGELPRRWESIAIEDFDPAWADQFAAIASLLRETLPDLVVDVDVEPISANQADSRLVVRHLCHC